MTTSLTEMPEDIIFRISSSLTNRETAHVGVLSKACRNLMRRRPSLVFDYTATPNRPQSLDQTSMLARYRRELRSIQSSLVRYTDENIDLETFIFRANWFHCRRLQTTSPEDFNLYNNCIGLAMRKGVRNLDLSMWEDYVLRVPAAMESLEQFSARCCLLQVEGTVVSWPNLKKLRLIGAILTGVAAFDSIIRGCPLLEDLELDFYKYEGEVANLRLKVVNLRNLKKVKARLCQTQTIDVVGSPNLESLVCRFKEQVRSIRLDWIRQRTPYSNLTKLSIYNVKIGESYLLHLAQMFPKLIHLAIKLHRPNRKIKIASETIKILHIASDGGFEEAEFDVPSITLFKFRLGYEFKMPKLCFTRTSKRWISRIRIRCYTCINSCWFVELMDMILNPVSASQTFLAIDFFSRVIFDEIKIIQHTNPFPGIPEIEEFYTNRMHYGKHSPESFKAVLENIFWICRPKTVVFRNRDSYENEHPRMLHGFLWPVAGPSNGWTLLWKPPVDCVCAWKVTGIKVFRHVKAKSKDYYCRVGRGLELLPEAVDCEAFLKALNDHEQTNNMFISGFELKWKICDMHVLRI